MKVISFQQSDRYDTFGEKEMYYSTIFGYVFDIITRFWLMLETS